MVTVYTTHGSKSDSTPMQREPISFRPSDAIKATNPKDLCGKGSEIFFKPREMVAYVTPFFCKRWDHPPCARFKRIRAITTATECYDQLWSIEVGTEAIEAYGKRIKRRGGDYWTSRFDGRALLLSSVDLEGTKSLTSGNAIEKAMEPWLQPMSCLLGKAKRISHSCGWGKTSVTQVGFKENTNTGSGEGADMAKDGQGTVEDGRRAFRFALEEAPSEVIGLLASMGCSCGDPGFIMGPATGDREDAGYVVKADVVKVNLNQQGLDLLTLLASGKGDPEGRLHLASKPSNDEGY